MTDDRLRRCSIHGPELRAYVEALVKAEAERAVMERQPELRDEGGETVVTDDDGGWDE
jgi:hypothetical protein